MLGRILVGFVCLNLQVSVSWLVNFQWVRVAQYLDFCVMIGGILVGFVWLNLLFSVSWLVDFQWVRVAQTLVFCVMVGGLLVGFVRLNLQFSVSWQVDFQWGSCGSIFCFLCHGWQTFSGVRVAQSLVFCDMVGRLLVGFVRLNLQFSGSRLATFSGVRVAQSLFFCLMVGRLLVGFVWLNLQFSASLFAYFQWVSCISIFSFLRHGWESLLVGFVWLKLQLSVSRQVDFQWGSRSSIFSFLWHGWQTFSGVREAQTLVFCVKVCDFQWVSCGSIFKFLFHDWWTFSWVRVAQSFVFCVMVGRLLVGFVWLNLQFSVSWLVDFQWASCGSIFSFLCHCRQTYSGLRVAQSLVFCVIVGRFLVGFVWSNLQFSLSWLVDFQWDSCGSIFSLLCYGRQTFSGVREAQSVVFWVKFGDCQWGSFGAIFGFLCHGWQTFSGFVWLNIQISVS